MGRRREYELEVRAVIPEKDGATVVTLRGAEASGSLSLPQAKETLKPGTVVQVTLGSMYVAFLQAAVRERVEAGHLFARRTARDVRSRGTA